MAAAIIILVMLGLMDLMLFVACFEMEKDEEVRRQMSWYSDKESFNEYDDPYCVWKSTANGGKCGNSKEECDRCLNRHREEEAETQTEREGE